MRLKIALTLALALVTPAAAQSNYTTLNWGLDKTSSPYAFGSNIGGTWRNLGTVSSGGVWSIPSSNLTFTQSGTGAVTRQVLCTNTGGATTYAWAYN